MILVAYRHGLRVAELCALRWDQVDLKQGLLHVQRLKQGLPSVHPLRGPELRALRRVQRDMPSAAYVFTTARGSPMTSAGFRKLLARTGDASTLAFPIHPHMLRHACGYKLANDGHDTRAIQHYLGHKNIQHTVRYTVLRADRGQPRVMAREQLEHYCELIAALKLRTSNTQGRHLSTAEAIRLLETYGVETPAGHVQAPTSLLTKTTVKRYLKRWGYDYTTLRKQPPAVRFQAEESNACWQFDLSPSDLKHVKAPQWMQEGRGRPLLMLYSVVDDRSGVAYQEYHGVYGEDVEAALRFLFAAMAPKNTEAFPFQGIPHMLYMDNGPIARSLVFQQVMSYLGVDVRTHMPRGSDGRRVTARAKGKVERPFRTVKEMHETLYHFHEPETEDEANAWLKQFLLRYNTMQHRAEPHSRFEDWLHHLPASGIRAMCSWERFCTFAREPEHRKVGIDARVSVDGVPYEVDPDLAGETVTLWWGLFDQDLYVERGEQRYGPYAPAGGPIPLHRYRRFKKTATQQRADRIEDLAITLSLSRAALE